MNPSVIEIAQCLLQDCHAGVVIQSSMVATSLQEVFRITVIACSPCPEPIEPQVKGKQANCISEEKIVIPAGMIKQQKVLHGLRR